MEKLRNELKLDLKAPSLKTISLNFPMNSEHILQNEYDNVVSIDNSNGIKKKDNVEAVTTDFPLNRQG